MNAGDTLNPRDDDARLVLAARRGDRAALAVLLGRHRPLVRALCERALQDGDLAEDAAQEAALQAMLNLDRLRRPERFGSWMAGIGLNVCRRWRRTDARAAWSLEAVLGGRFGPELVDAGSDPSEQAETEEERALVRRAVAGLPPGQRSAVVFHYLAGLPLAEVGALLGIEANAVKARLHKARGTLRRTLAAPLGMEEVEMGKVVSRRTVAKAAGAVTLGNLGAFDARADQAPAFVEVAVVDVRRRLPNNEGARQTINAVVLEEVGGGRRLPIWMGPFEAEMIALRIEGIESPRPMTYAFAAGLLAAAGGALREVRIERLTDEVFYASAIVEGTDGARAVDARPSDALNLALLAGAPVFVAEEVLDRVTAMQSADDWRALAEQSEGAAAIAAATQAARQWPPAPNTDPTSGGEGSGESG